MFKKIQIIFMVCVLFIGILPSLGLEAKAAEQVTADGFGYELTADGEAIIITGYDDEISLTANIPSEIEGKPVVEIGEGAFANKKITEITIPDSVTSIGSIAFAHTDKLTHIDIPNSMTYIGNLTFFEATGLTSISIPDSVTLIGTSAFLEATALKTIEIPNSVKSIGYGAFQGATALTHVDLPNGLDSIGEIAFQNATALTHVDLPHSLDYIGKQAFLGATALESIKFNTPVTYLGENVFEGVPDGLKVIGFSGSIVENYINDGNSSSPGKYIFEGSEYEVTAEDFGYNLTDDGEGVIITSYDDNISLKPKIPSEIEGKPVVGIDSYVFAGSEITEITIPNSVKSIGEAAFAETTGLTNIILPNNLKNIGNYAFEEATGLKSIEIPNSVESIGNYAFSGMTGIMSIKLPNNLKSIGESAFLGMTGITTVEIPNGVESIGDYAFEDATSLKTIKFNTPSIVIGDDIFYDIPDGLKVIGFKDSRLEKYINESNEESAGRFIFEGSDYKLRDSDFSYELTEDGHGAIITGYNDSVLSNPIIPSTFEGKPVVEIGASAFYDSEITGITIPKTVKVIGESAFEDTRSLRSVEIPNGVVSIGDYAFEDTRKLTSITIPNSVKHIGEGAFEDARILTSIEIPNSVETIGDYAFEDMEALKTIKFHNPLTALGEDVFKDVPEGLKVIGFKGSIVETYIKVGNEASPTRFIFESLSYKVTFNSNGGTKVASANTNEKRLIAQPKAPTKANHRFEGWYTDAKYKTKWDFKTVVEKDVTLYAKWTFVAPAIVLKNSTNISDVTVQVTGTTSPNSAVRIVQGSKEIGKGKSDTKGNFTIKISKVKAGSTVEIQVTDAYGNKKSFKKTVADKTAPKVTVPKVNAANTKIVGTAEAKSKIELVINKKVTKATTSAKGNYSISIKKQKAGTKMTLTVSDAAGNKTKKTITVLAAPKPVTVASISDKQDTITGKTEAKAKVKIYVSNKHVKTVTANSKGAYSYKVGKKKAGTSIKVIATDQAGNTTTKTVKVLDKTAPAKPSVKSVKASSTTVVGKAEAKSTVYVYKGKTLLGKATTSSKGNYTVKIKKQKKGTTLLVKAQDKAKNMSKNTSIKVK